MIGQEIVYAPCPCGSGKKFKFCCFKKYRDRLNDDMTLARKLTSERASRMAANLEDMSKSEDESEAREEAECLADVDANGIPRVPFYVLPLQNDIRRGLTDEEYETVGLAHEMSRSQIEPTNEKYVRLENALVRRRGEFALRQDFWNLGWVDRKTMLWDNLATNQVRRKTCR